MRLDYLTLSAFTQGTAGYTHVHEVVGGLQELGASVELFVPRYRRLTRSVLTRARVMLGLQAKLAIRWLFFKSKPDVLYIRHHYVAVPITLMARLLRIPVVVEVNGPVEDFIVSWSIPALLAPIVRLSAYWQCRLGTWVIGVTTGLVELLSREYGVSPERITLIPNGVNTNLFKPIPKPDLRLWPQLRDKKFVVFVGALSPWQGIEMMLEAVESSHWPGDISLVIAGDGLLREQFERRSISRLVYLGNIPYERVPHLVSASLAGLCLINDLGRKQIGVSPLKLYEYTACGRPVIVTDIPGLEDFVSDSDCGLVVPCDNARALSEAVGQISNDPARAEEMGQAGAERVRDGYSWLARAEETLKILRKVSR